MNEKILKYHEIQAIWKKYAQVDKLLVKKSHKNHILMKNRKIIELKIDHLAKKNVVKISDLRVSISWNQLNL